MAALLRLARSDPLAGRTILQAMLPGLKALAAGFLKRDPDRDVEPALERDELWQVLFLAMLERIAAYPLARRPRKIAANLLLDTKHAVLAELQRSRSAYRELPKEEPVEPAAWWPWPAEDVEAPLRRAVAAKAISAADADLILQTEIEGVPLREVAERLGISYNAAKIRRQRAERRLLMFLRPWTQDLYVQGDPRGRSKRPSSGAYAPEATKKTADQAG